MTNALLRIKTAEALEWVDCYVDPDGIPVGNAPGRWPYPEMIPDYPSCLNACHAFEKQLGFHDAGMYGVHSREAHRYWRELKNAKPDRLYASAEQRCRALVKVMSGKAAGKAGVE